LAVALWAMPPSSNPSPVTIQTSRVLLDRVQTVQSHRSTRFAGVTQAKNRASLSFAVPARVSARLVEPGSAAAAGEILASLDDREYRNAVDLAQASVTELKTQWEQAKRDHRRIEQLAASQVVTVSDLEKTITREAALAASLQAAEARLKEARRLLKETILRAPFSGTVTGIHIQPGEWAVPGQPAVELTGDGELELLVEVPETVVVHLTAGQSVRVLLPFADNRMVPGRISTVAKAALSAGRLFPVKVDLAAEPGVNAGLTAQLLLDLPTTGDLTVPLAAVVNPGASQPFVFICREGRVTRQPVLVGPIIDERIVVRGAIAEGDAVVVTGQSRLADGDRVEVAS
jgi:RND family efflux transporter MFP subunit